MIVSLSALKELTGFMEKLKLGWHRKCLELTTTPYPQRYGNFIEKIAINNELEEFRVAHESFLYHTNLKNITDACQLILTKTQYEELKKIILDGGNNLPWKAFVKISTASVFRNRVLREKRMEEYYKQKTKILLYCSTLLINKLPTISYQQ